MFYPNYGGFGYVAIHDARRTAEHASSKARANATNIVELEHRIDRLAVLCGGLWSMLKDRLDMTDEELVDATNAIDLLDGRLDNKNAPSAVPCPECRRTVSKRRMRCIYCSAHVTKPPFSSV